MFKRIGVLILCLLIHINVFAQLGGGFGFSSMGNMMKSTYDVDDNGVVDVADSVAGISSSTIINKFNKIGVSTSANASGLAAEIINRQTGDYNVGEDTGIIRGLVDINTSDIVGIKISTGEILSALNTEISNRITGEYALGAATGTNAANLSTEISNRQTGDYNVGKDTGLLKGLVDGKQAELSTITWIAADSYKLGSIDAANYSMDYQQVVTVAQSSGNYTTIQAALDASGADTLIRVAPGTYTDDTINYTANNQCVRGMSLTSFQVVTAADAVVCNFGDYTGCCLENMRLILTNPSSAISLVTGSTGTLCMRWCCLKVSVSQSISNVRQPSAIHSAGAVKMSKGTIDYDNTGIYNLAIKASVVTLDDASFEFSRVNIDIDCSGTAWITTPIHASTSSTVNTYRCNINVNDSDVAVAIGLLYTDGADVETMSNDVHVTGAGNLCCGYYMLGSGSIRSISNHIHVESPGGTAKWAFLGVNAALTSQLDDIIAVDGYTNNGTLVFASSLCDGDLLASGRISASSFCVTGSEIVLDHDPRGGLRISSDTYILGIASATEHYGGGSNLTDVDAETLDSYDSTYFAIKNDVGKSTAANAANIAINFSSIGILNAGVSEFISETDNGVRVSTHMIVEGNISTVTFKNPWVLTGEGRVWKGRTLPLEDFRKGGTSPTNATKGWAAGLLFDADAETANIQVRVPKSWDEESDMILELKCVLDAAETANDDIDWEIVMLPCAHDSGNVLSVSTQTVIVNYDVGDNNAEGDQVCVHITFDYDHGIAPISMGDDLYIQISRTSNVGQAGYVNGVIVTDAWLKYSAGKFGLEK